MGQNSRHVGDKRWQMIAESLERTLILMGQGSLGHRLRQISKKPVFREELMPVGGPMVVLSQSTEVSVTVPAKLGVTRTRMQSSDVGGQALPVARLIFKGQKPLKEQKVLKVGQYIGSPHAPGGSKCVEPRRFHSEEAARWVFHCLGNEARAVSVT